MKKFIKQNKAITLIALVITIVILIILAGVLINITLGDNGIFPRAKLAKAKYEYQSAKEILELKLVEIQTVCLTDGSNDYTLNYVAEKLEDGNELAIDVMLYNPQAKKHTNEIERPGNVTGIVVIVNDYPRFEFLIGEKTGGIGIIGVKETTPDVPGLTDFIDLDTFEKDVLGDGKTPTPTPVAQEPEGTPEVAAITPPTDTSGSSIETSTIMLIGKYEIKKLQLEGLTNEDYTNIVPTNNIRIITTGDDKGTIITNDQAGSKDKLTLTLTGTYSGKSYLNNITVLVEPANMTTVTDKTGQSQDAFALYDVDDLLRFKEIATSYDPTVNAALMSNINLNNTDWTPIGWYTTGDSLGNWAKWTDKTQSGPWGTYKGIFDGRNNEIQNYSYSGVVGENEAVRIFWRSTGCIYKKYKI